ncbi:hypothetical protein G5714_016578 [Onychostoma macrolepis]|uniref:Uncharacterized protein n=1 Tax=Onychostoma macrolepis TaxID=369639 RepID=A0A7J6CAR0_9TELE|nr:hypothetical protein G5714_016578 [Onychostoma macrolepis]
MCEARLRWYDHIIRSDTVVKTATTWPKKRWLDCLTEDMCAINITPDDALDQAKWRKACNQADPAPTWDTHSLQDEQRCLSFNLLKQSSSYSCLICQGGLKLSYGFQHLSSTERRASLGQCELSLCLLRRPQRLHRGNDLLKAGNIQRSLIEAPRVLYSDDRQEDKNGHSYVKLDEDIVKRSCDKAVFKYYSV